MKNLSKPLPAIMAAAVLSMSAAPAIAWEEQGAAMKSLPSGGLMLKEVPGSDPNLQDLPGVNLNPQLGISGSTNCVQRRVTDHRYGFGEQSVTANECRFGNFSVTTYGSGSRGGGFGYNPFPVPGPLQQAGPPAGSGGFAPTQRSPFN